MSRKASVVLVPILMTVLGCKKDSVDPVNRPARFSSLADTYYGTEEKPIGTVYAWPKAIDQDNDPVFFSMAENSTFEIDSITGEITNRVVIDVDDVGGLKYFYFHLSVHDIHGEGETRSTIIKVGDSSSDNPAPEIQGPDSLSIPENTHDMVGVYTNSTGAWHLQDTTMGVFWLYPMGSSFLNSTAGVTLHATYQDYETLPNTFTGTLVYTYPASGQQSFLHFTLEVTNELDPF